MSAARLSTETRREQIAEAAVHIIHAQGLKGVRMESIARAVGVVPSALYRHFSGKDAVLDAVLDWLGRRLQGIVAEARSAESAPLAQLRSLLGRHARLIQRFQGIPRVLFSDSVQIENAGYKAKAYQILQDYLAQVAQMFRGAQDRGEIRADIAAETLSIMFLGLFQPAAVLWIMSDGAFDAEAHIERAWQVFFGGIDANLSRRSDEKIKSTVRVRSGVGGGRVSGVSRPAVQKR